MAVQFVYRHGVSGYAIHGMSNHSLRHSLLKRLEAEPFDPHLAEKTPVWRWMRIDADHRYIANMSLRAASTRNRALEIRGIILNTADCETIRWNPFLLAGMFDDDDLWTLESIERGSDIDLRSWLRRKTPVADVFKAQAEARRWQVVTTNIADLAHGMELLDTNNRKQIEFMATADPEGSNHRLLARSYNTSKAKASGASKVGSRLFHRLFIIAICTFGVAMGFWALSLSMERDRLATAVSEREQWLHEKENNLDAIKSELEQKRQQYTKEREDLRHKLLQLASSSVGAVELRGSIGGDVRRRRGHMQHYLDQAMLQDALEEWIKLERIYRITEERIGSIDEAASALRLRQQELNEELKRTQQMATVDNQVRQRLNRAVERIEQAADELLRVLQATDTDAPGDGDLR